MQAFLCCLRRKKAEANGRAGGGGVALSQSEIVISSEICYDINNRILFSKTIGPLFCSQLSDIAGNFVFLAPPPPPFEDARIRP